jgi:hypothetical protein
MASRELIHEGTLVLANEGLSKVLADDEQVVFMIAEAHSRGMEAVISALTIEAVHARTRKACLNWVLSGTTRGSSGRGRNESSVEVADGCRTARA